MKKSEKISSQLKVLPPNPGVYQYYDKEGTIIYVGKAKNLKKRVSSYFNKNKYDSGKTRILVSKIDDIKFIVVNTELDALLLENSLIKKYQPRYNMQLKDDKTFPSIVIKKERFPRIYATRNLVKDGSEYYGPFASVKTMHAVLDLVKKLYPIRTCNYNLSEKNVNEGKFRVCLEFHIGNCLGPCENKFSEEDYEKNVGSIRKILKGNLNEAIKDLKQLMNNHAEAYEFEDAQNTKVKLQLLQKFQVKSTIVNPSISNVEVYAIVTDNKFAFINYMRINHGVIVQGRTIEIKKSLDETEEDLLKYAIIEAREQALSTINDIFVPFEIDLPLPDVKISVPLRGDKKKLVELSTRNAKYFMLDKHKQQEIVDPESHQQRILETLKSDLRLKELPVHIECFDNSNIQGNQPSSACVVFKNAKPSKDDYRKFNIKTVVGPDDFASMEEVVFRRYKRLVEEDEPLPQLIIIDGGKGQLSSSLKALEQLGLRGKIAIIGIAKRLEEIFFPGDTIPIYIDKRSESLKLIQKLRNEAHRFSLAHHRNRRSKEFIKTSLTDIPGVGSKTSETLLLHFKSVKNIQKATLKELEEVVNRKVAIAVHNHYKD